MNVELHQLARGVTVSSIERMPIGTHFALMERTVYEQIPQNNILMRVTGTADGVDGQHAICVILEGDGPIGQLFLLPLDLECTWVYKHEYKAHFANPNLTAVTVDDR